jgi:membrane-associated phospholipid phosphatase
VFAVLAARSETFPGDREGLEAIQSLLGSWYAPVADFLNGPGGFLAGVSLWVACPLLLVPFGRFRLALAFLFAGALRPLLTVLASAIDRPRPSGAEVTVREVVPGPSFPSGHAMTAAVLLGMIFFVAPLVLPPRMVPAVRILSVLITLLAGVSRVWAGAHWPSDVYGAFAWGLLLVFFVMLFRPALGWPSGRGHRHVGKALRHVDHGRRIGERKNLSSNST